MPEEAMSQEAIDRLLNEMKSGKAPLEAVQSKSDSEFGAAARAQKTAQRTLENEHSHIVPSGSKKIRDYDFRRPNRISKEHMRGLRMIHENFARDIPRAWGSMLRAGGQVKITSMEQTIYEEFRNHLSPHCLLGVVSLPPLEGEIAFYMELETAFILIDRLLGGPGSELKRTREFTTLELNLLNKVIAALLPFFLEAGLPVISLEPQIDRILSNVEFLQLTALNESVLVTIFQARYLNTDMDISLCIPYTMIAPILTRVNLNENQQGHVGSDELDKQRMRKIVNHVPFEIAARLGSAPVPIAELTKLKVNDIIRLDIHVDGAAEILVNGKAHFAAKPGLYNGSLSMQISDILKNMD